jgi:hypothetical protein
MSDDPAKPVTVETNGVSQHLVTTKSRTAKDFFVFRRRFVYWVVGGFVAAGAFGTYAFWDLFQGQQDIADRAQESVENLTEDVTLLRQQLGEAQRQINEGRAATDELTTCRGAFSNEVSERTSIILIELTQLLAVLANDIPNDTAPAIAEIEIAGNELKKAQEARAQYELDGTPLPCPITVSDLPD